jgi:hypothetical protein
MTEETPTRKEDRAFLEGMSKKELVDLMFAHIRSLWSVDGLYYIGIEERFSTEAATAIDANCWKIMGTIECRRLRKTTGIQGKDLDSFIELFKRTSWALDLENRVYSREGDTFVIRNTGCRVQLTRRKKGLVEFPCKVVRIEFMTSFAKEFNPDIKVECRVCPPDKHPDDLWCEWAFTLAE